MAFPSDRVSPVPFAWAVTQGLREVLLINSFGRRTFARTGGKCSILPEYRSFAMLMAFLEAGEQLLGVEWPMMPGYAFLAHEPPFGRNWVRRLNNYSLSPSPPQSAACCPPRILAFLKNNSLGLRIHVNIFFSQLHQEVPGCFRFLGLSELVHVKNAVRLGYGGLERRSRLVPSKFQM